MHVTSMGMIASKNATIFRNMHFITVEFQCMKIQYQYSSLEMSFGLTQVLQATICFNVNTE